MRRAVRAAQGLMTLQVVKSGALLVLLASVATASTVATRHQPVRAAAPFSQLVVPSVTPATNVEFSATDLRQFRAVAHRPAATAPVRRLPKVQVALLTVQGIPPVAMHAYQLAAQSVVATTPGCRLRWWLVAGIGLVESGHARSGGSLRAGWNGVAKPAIRGPVLNGSHGFKAIRDTDNGAYDGDTTWDRAVGPMQFLPSTWLRWSPPGKINGRADPQNIRAAAWATAHYLCAGGLDLATPHAMALAVYSYNHSFDYVRLVLSVAARYAGMTADQLGVNLLPTDRSVKHHRHHHRAKSRHKKKAAHPTATSAMAQPSQSPTASGAAASPSPSSSPQPSSAPSSSRPTPPPLPTLPPPPFG